MKYGKPKMKRAKGKKLKGKSYGNVGKKNALHLQKPSISNVIEMLTKKEK